jgi:geranylgeranylglycerol-phosphate geranylgeranyltransferase
MMAFLATLGREIVKDIEDMESDFNRRTLPMRLGKRKSGIVGSISFATAVALSPVPYFTGAFGVEYLLMVVLADTIFIYCSIIHFQNPKRGQKVAKIGMMVALLAFLVGGLL